MLTAIKDFFLDLIFPPACAGCRVEGCYLCPACQATLRVGTALFCPGCRQPAANGQTCQACSKQTDLDGLIIIADYNQRLLASLIQRLKYQYIEIYARILAQLIKTYWQKEKLSRRLADFIFVPVPLNKRRLKERGFNQSLIVLEELNRLQTITLAEELLARIRYTQPQMELSAAERQKNILEAFACPRPELVNNKNIILFDDVYTTGATLNECAKILKQAGAKAVWGLALAHGTK